MAKKNTKEVKTGKKNKNQDQDQDQYHNQNQNQQDHDQEQEDQDQDQEINKLFCEEVDANRLYVMPAKQDDKSIQYVNYPRYLYDKKLKPTPTNFAEKGDLPIIITGPIKMIRGGIPRYNDQYHKEGEDSMNRAHVFIPKNSEDPHSVELFKCIKKIDDRMDNEINKKKGTLIILGNQGQTIPLKGYTYKRMITTAQKGDGVDLNKVGDSKEMKEFVPWERIKAKFSTVYDKNIEQGAAGVRKDIDTKIYIGNNENYEDCKTDYEQLSDDENNQEYEEQEQEQEQEQDQDQDQEYDQENEQNNSDGENGGNQSEPEENEDDGNGSEEGHDGEQNDESGGEDSDPANSEPEISDPDNSDQNDSDQNDSDHNDSDQDYKPVVVKAPVKPLSKPNAPSKVSTPVKASIPVKAPTPVKAPNSGKPQVLSKTPVNNKISEQYQHKNQTGNNGKNATQVKKK
nr:glutamic acid-rich protein-like [Hydra vulgaris]